MAWIYWLVGSFFYFYQFIFRTIFSTMGNEVAVGFNVPVSDLSIFFAAGMLTYSLMQVPGGLLLDRYGTRKVLTIAIFSLSLGILIVGTTASYPLAILGRVLMGLGSAFGFLGTSKIITMWFPIRMMSFLVGTTVFLGGMGGAFSKDLFSVLPAHWDWRQTLLSMGSMGVLLAITTGLILRERKFSAGDKAPKKEINETPVPTTLFGSFFEVLSNRQILLAGFFTFFAYIPISVLADSWGPLAFEKMFNVDKEVADKTITYFYIAFSTGSLFYSLVASYFNRIRHVLLFECIAMLVFLYLLLVRTDIGMTTFFGVPGFLILSSLIAFNIGGVALAFTIGCANARKEVSGTVVGIMNMLCMVSGSICSKLVGNLLNHYWDGQLGADGLPTFSGLAYQSALQPLIITTIFAILCMYFVKENSSSYCAEKA